MKFRTTFSEVELSILKQRRKITKAKKDQHIHTALRNHLRIVFKEMPSWTPLTMYLLIKTTF